MSEPRKHFIVLGAGASYDFIDSSYLPSIKKHTWNSSFRPPLASGLFDPARFGEILDRYETVKDLSSSVLSALKAGKDLEEYLQELKKLGGHRIPQLVGLIFYLGELFNQISDEFGGATGNNYNSLIQAIRDNGGNACIVTFNYDFLLESELREQFPKGKHTLNDYIRHGIQVIKMHGSCEWSYVSGPYSRYRMEDIVSAGGLEKYLANNPRGMFNLDTAETVYKEKPEIIPRRKFREETESSFREDVTYLSYPALAVPMRTKHSNICPDEHVEEIKKTLASVSKILIIGWKAADENLLDIFKETIRYPVEFTLVNGKGSKSVEDIKKRISDKVPTAYFKIVDDSFTGFMGSEDRDIFFSNSLDGK